MSAVSQKAANLMEQWISKHGTDDRKAMLDYAYALSTHYGEAIGSLACRMYEETAAAQKAIIKAAEAAATPDYGEVAKAINGTLKRSENMVPSTVGRLVKQVGADTTLKNAMRDKAEWAWVPMGDTCAFCLTLASRGWQRQRSSSHAEHIHANCDCQYAVRFDGKSTVQGYDPDEYREMYENAEGRTPQEKINSMRRTKAAENRATMDFMSNSFRPKYGNTQVTVVDSTKVPMKPVENSKINLFADEDYGKKNKAVRLAEKKLIEIQKRLPEGFEMPKIAVVDFDNRQLGNNAIGGYKRELNTVFINGKYDTDEKIIAYIRQKAGRYANQTAEAPYLHELGHKYYYDKIDNLARTSNMSYDKAKGMIDHSIDNCVTEMLNKSADGKLDSIMSGYAKRGYLSGNYTEVIAECFSVREENDIARAILQSMEVNIQ